MRKKQNDTPLTEVDAKRIRRNAYIKMAAMAGIVAAAMAFGSVAWFTSNKEVEGTGVGVKVGSLPYQIVPLEGKTSIYQHYLDIVHTNSTSTDTIAWQMTAENNVENFDNDTDTGIAPDSFGVISFYVKPRDESVDLDLVFELKGYSYTSETNEDTEETIENMTAVSDELQQYLNGHILLFENRTAVKDANTGEITSYIYSDPILPDSNNQRKISNRTFTKADENKQMDIYWVWPKTLSTLVDASSNSFVNTMPFTEGDDYKKICNDILTNPSHYFYNYSQEYDIDGNAVELTIPHIAESYDRFGDLFDRVDNQIGMNVNYITLNMSTAESESEGE